MNYEDLLKYFNLPQENTSNVYDKLVQSLNELGADFEKKEYPSITEKRRALGRVIDACDIYTTDKAHKGINDNDEKVAKARELRNYLTKYYDDAVKAENKEIAKTAEQIKKTKRTTAEDFQKAAKLQRNIGVVNFKAKLTQISRTQSKASNIWSYIKHGLFTALHTISNATLGGLAYIATAIFNPTSRNAARITTELDTDIIPGTNGERFADVKDEVDDGAPDQEILKDSRRVPLAYERKIMDDPNEKPTVTFNFHQASDGRSVGYDKQGRMGHGFITLRYTKKNPITGLNERFETSFGFYPKGGFIGSGELTGEVLNGLYVPGQLRNDFGHEVSVGKTVEISNKQVNQMLLAAQKYEKDGYNAIKRNCTTFVHDIGEAAGLDMEFMQPTDLDIEKNAKLKLGLVFGGATMSRVGSSHMLSMAERDDYSYQRLGQKMINKEDVLRLDKREYNMQMKGYVPSRIAEVIRSEQGSEFKYNSVAEGETPWTYKEALVAIDREKNILLSQIESTYVGNEEVRQVSNRLGTYLFSKYQILKKTADEAFTGKILEQQENDKKNKSKEEEPPKVAKYLSVKEQREKLQAFAKEIDNTIKDIEEMYHESFKGDPALNAHFRRYVANFHKTKELTQKAYDETLNRMRYSASGVKDRHIQDDDYNMFIDPSRDDAEALKSFMFEDLEFFSNEGNIFCDAKRYLVAGIKAFGSLEETYKYNDLLKKEQQEKEGKEKLTEQERKDLKKYEKKAMSIFEFANIQDTIYSGREYTKEDYRFAFIELPKQEKDIGYRDQTTVMTLAETYQGIAFGKVFGGLKQELFKLTPKEVLENPSMVSEIVSKHIAKQMEDPNNKEFLKLRDVFLESTMKDHPFDQEKDDPVSYLCNAKAQAFEKLHTAIMRNYVAPITKEVSYKMIVGTNKEFDKKDPEVKKANEKQHYEESKVIRSAFDSSNMDFINSPAAKEYRAQIVKHFGVQPNLKKIRSEAALQVGRDLDLKQLKNDPASRKALGTLLAVQSMIKLGPNRRAKDGVFTDEFIEKQADYYAKKFEGNDELFFSVAKEATDAYKGSSAFTPKENELIDKLMEMEQKSKEKSNEAKLKEGENLEKEKSKDLEDKPKELQENKNIEIKVPTGK